MAQNQQHGEQSIGGSQTQDGIQGTPSGTEGATSGQGVDKGEQRDPGPRQSTQDHGNRQAADNDTYQRNDLWREEGSAAGNEAGNAARADSQQSAQRETMGKQGPGTQHADKNPNRER